MWTKLFWKDASERAIKTFAQTLVALLGTSAVSIVSLDWSTFLGVAATAAVVSVLTSVASAAATKNTPTVSPASAATDNRGI